jgi:hypothetical protein
MTGLVISGPLGLEAGFQRETTRARGSDSFGTAGVIRSQISVYIIIEKGTQTSYLVAYEAYSSSSNPKENR